MSKSPSLSLEQVLNRANGVFVPDVRMMLFDGTGRIAVTDVVVLSRQDTRTRGDTTPRSLVKKLELDIAGLKHVERYIRNAPVLTESQILISTGGCTKYVTFIIAGMFCGNLKALKVRETKKPLRLWNIEDVRARLLKQKEMPEYIWHIYNQALKALELLMRELK